MSPPPAARKNPFGWVVATILLLATIIAAFWIPLYARKTPKLGAFPFFYWYQLSSSWQSRSCHGSPTCWCARPPVLRPWRSDPTRAIRCRVSRADRSRADRRRRYESRELGLADHLDPVLRPGDGRGLHRRPVAPRPGHAAPE